MKLPRRRFLHLAAGAAAVPAVSGIARGQVATSKPRPFRVEIPQAKIDRILARVRETEFPDRLDAPDLRYGVSWDYMKALVQYWTTQFDWRKAEANLSTTRVAASTEARSPMSSATV
jgi:hypothetical protein